MNFKDLENENKRLKNEIDAYHLFYEDFNRYDLMISNSFGILSEMYSNVIKAKKTSENPEIKKQEKRINDLIDIFSQMQGLNNKCHNLSLRFKHLNQAVFNLKSELKAIKQAHNETT